MRAYTSLVGHLLGSHPEIDGYYEMHQSYASAEDLARQAQRYAEQHSLKPGGRYLFDKLLHNDYTLALEQLDPDRTIVLMALRPPEPTLKSIVSLFARKPGDDPYADPIGAATYYIERLHALAAFGQQYPRRFYYFDAALIRTDTERVLAALGAWLQLGSPLAERYQSFARTGVAGAGDSSPAIASGRVVRAGKHLSRHRARRRIPAAGAGGLPGLPPAARRTRRGSAYRVTSRSHAARSAR